MLKIRPEQLEAFHPLAEAAFETRVVEYLRAEHPDVEVPISIGSTTIAELAEEALVEMIRTRLQRAQAYGMTWESSLTAFVVLTFLVSANFDHHPAIARILKDETVAPDLRIDQLWDQTSEEDWKAAAQAEPGVSTVVRPIDESAIIQRLDEAWWISRDDVARNIVAELSSAELRNLSVITRERLARELETGYVSEADRLAMDKIAGRGEAETD